jgi:hypothetical protein
VGAPLSHICSNAQIMPLDCLPSALPNSLSSPLPPSPSP